MMNKYRLYKYVGLFPALLLWSACSGDRLPQIEGSEQVPLSIGGANLGLAVTRASEVELTGSDKAIGIFVKQLTTYTAVNNRKYTYASPEWQVEGTPVLLSVDRATLAAYYPYKESLENPLDLMSGQAYAAAEDYCYSKLTADSKNSSVVLSLKRVYALVRFRLVAAQGSSAYQQEGRVSAISFRLSGSIPTARLDMFSGTLSSAFPAADYTYATDSGFSTLLGTSGVPADVAFLMIPAALKNDLSFTLTIDGKEMAGQVSIASLCGTSGGFVAGTRYDIGITVHPTGLRIHADAQPWTEVPVSGGYEL